MKKRFIRYSLGIDVSKDEFDNCIYGLEDDQRLTVLATRKFSNTPAGFREHVKWLRKNMRQELPLAIVMEATGVYHENLAHHLSDSGFSLSIVLPTKARYYLQSLGHKSKNDRSDAKGLAHLGARHELRIWEPTPLFYRELRQLTRHHQSIQELKNVIANQLKALSSGNHSSRDVTSQLRATLGLLEKQRKQTIKNIRAHIKSDPEVDRKIGHLCTIVGIRTLTAATVVAETAGFSLMENQRQLVSYAGYDVVENQSGKKAGKTCISKRGNSRIRRILFMPSMTAGNSGPLAPFYERVHERTGLHKKAQVAVQRKLLILMYTLWKKDEPFRDMTAEDDTQQGKEVATVADDETSIDQGDDASLTGLPKGGGRQVDIKKVAPPQAVPHKMNIRQTGRQMLSYR